MQLIRTAGVGRCVSVPRPPLGQRSQRWMQKAVWVAKVGETDTSPPPLGGLLSQFDRWATLRLLKSSSILPHFALTPRDRKKGARSTCSAAHGSRVCHRGLWSFELLPPHPIAAWMTWCSTPRRYISGLRRAKPRVKSSELKRTKQGWGGRSVREDEPTSEERALNGRCSMQTGMVLVGW